MSITNKLYNNLQLTYEQQQIDFASDIVGINLTQDGSNCSLQNWSGHDNFFVPFESSTIRREYDREAEIDSEWSNIARLSREQWAKENPY